MHSSRDIERLLAIMAALRTPGSGCPWDLEQDFATIAPYTIEEAYEVAEAIARGDLLDLKDELGDLLLQVVFHARMAEEAGAFDFGDVVESITGKLIRRHPHVFGDARDLSPAGVKALWGEIKEAEKAERRRERGEAGEPAAAGLLAGVPAGLPALARAEKLTRKAATVGFDWPDAAQVVGKIEEEVREVREALAGRRARRDRGRDRRSPVRGGQSRPPCRRRPRIGASPRQREVRAPLRRRRASPRGRRQNARRRLPRRHGRPLGEGEGARSGRSA